MLVGLTRQEFRKVMLSVGDAHGRERPLSPVEVCNACRKAVEAGASRAKVARAFQIDSAMVGRFLRLGDLPSEIHHLLDWGKSKESALGFSAASELGRAPRGEQADLAVAVLKHGITKEEIRSIVQLHERSGEPLRACTTRVLGRR